MLGLAVYGDGNPFGDTGFGTLGFWSCRRRSVLSFAPLEPCCCRPLHTYILYNVMGTCSSCLLTCCWSTKVVPGCGVFFLLVTLVVG